MAWTTPKTDWETGELVAASDMNAIGENLAELKQLSGITAAYTTTDHITLNSRSFSDVDSANLNLAITTRGGDILVHFHGEILVGTGQSAYFDVDVDGTRQGGIEGLGRTTVAAHGGNMGSIVSFTRLIQGLSAGAHTVKLVCKTTTRINLGEGAQFWVREI